MDRSNIEKNMVWGPQALDNLYAHDFLFFFLQERKCPSLLEDLFLARTSKTPEDVFTKIAMAEMLVSASGHSTYENCFPPLGRYFVENKLGPRKGGECREQISEEILTYSKIPEVRSLLPRGKITPWRQELKKLAGLLRKKPQKLKTTSPSYKQVEKNFKKLKFTDDNVYFDGPDPIKVFLNQLPLTAFFEICRLDKIHSLYVSFEETNLEIAKVMFLKVLLRYYAKSLTQLKFTCLVSPSPSNFFPCISEEISNLTNLEKVLIEKLPITDQEIKLIAKSCPKLGFIRVERAKLTRKSKKYLAPFDLPPESQQLDFA